MGLVRAFKRMMEVIDEGHPLVILPEGTISKIAPKLIEFKTICVISYSQANSDFTRNFYNKLDKAAAQRIVEW